MKIATFIQKHRITMAVRPAIENPHMTDMAPDSRHWLCKFYMGRAWMPVHFSQGPAHTSEPTISDVLSCLATDAGLIEGETFETWASALGFDTDSRKAEKTYNACVAQSDRLKAFLAHSDWCDPDPFDELLHRVDPL